MTRLRLAWVPRDAPLPARAAVATGDAARALGRRLAALDDAALAALTAVAGDDVLVVLGDEAALPWIDGVAYLGRDPAAPELLLPTALAPTIPPAALALAIRARLRDRETISLRAGETDVPRRASRSSGERESNDSHSPGAPPVAVLASPPRLVACDRALAIDRGRLAAWLAETGDPA